MIRKSTDWYAAEYDLLSKGRKIGEIDDLRDMLRNVGNRVSELSREEVKARTHRSNHASELLEKINEDIELIEEYILIAILAG